MTVSQSPPEICDNIRANSSANTLTSTSPQPTRLPFDKAFSQLKAERGMTFREIAEATRRADPEGRGLSNPYLSRLARGEVPATLSVIELIAEAFEIPVEYFAEARLAAARGQFDERSRGFDAALSALERLDSANIRALA